MNDARKKPLSDPSRFEPESPKSVLKKRKKNIDSEDHESKKKRRKTIIEDEEEDNIQPMQLSSKITVLSDDEDMDIMEPPPDNIHMEKDSDDSEDEDEKEDKKSSGKVSVSNSTTTAEVFQYIHGTDEEHEEFEARCAKFTSEDWTRLGQSLFSSTLDTGCSNRDLLQTFKMFYQVFCFPYKDEYSVIDRVKAIYPHVATMKDQFKKIQRLFGLLHFELIKRKLIDDSKFGREATRMLTMISFGMKMSFDILVSNRLLQKGVDKSMKAMLEEMNPLTFFQEKDTRKMKKHQQLLFYYYHIAFIQNLRKDKECLYKPRYNNQNEFVYSYEYVSEMSDFVFQGLFPIEQNHYWFDCLTERGGTAKMCVDMLTNLKSEWLPDLERNHDIHAFQNGLFVLSLNSFFFFKKLPNRNWVGQLSGNLTAIKYHDMIFDEDGMNADMEAQRDRTYMSIFLESVHGVLAYQQFEMEERLWIFCLLGRMLHKVNEYDNWSVFIYFLGLAGTGKSTLLRLVASLLESRDIGYLNNSLQKTFSLDGIHDKLMYLALDIDETFQLDQVTWQSMVSGEEVSVTRKFKQPITLIWKSHGGFAGNKLPGWTDNAGSLSRRLIVIEFLIPVSKSDPNLYERCLAASDRFLKVINSAYMHMAKKYNNRGIKEVLPPKFKKSEEKALLELNLLLAMMKDSCDLDPEPEKKTYITTMKNFTKAYKNFCKRSSLKPKTMNYNYYSGVFSKYQIKVNSNPELNDPYGQKEAYIIGLKLKDNAIESMNE